MRRFAVVLIPAAAISTLVILQRCASSGTAGMAAGAHAASPGTAAPAETGSERTAQADRIDFTTRILPLLQEKCSPCHFPGGRMYDRLPFDKEMTIRLLGTRLFTRLREPEDQEILGVFLEQSQATAR